MRREPLRIRKEASWGTIGVLGVGPATPQAFAAPAQLHLLETFAAQRALAVERGMLAEEAQHAQLRVRVGAAVGCG
jgi:two-component system sensor histidine kinase KdpD